MTKQMQATRTDVYLKNGGGKCPACLSKSIEAGSSTNVEGDSVYIPITCNECEAEWEDEYTLAGITNAEGFDPDDIVASTKEVELDYGISITTNIGGAGISSHLKEQFSLDGEDDNVYAEGASDALESFLLAMASEGIGLEGAAMKSALKTAVESIGNNAG